MVHVLHLYWPFCWPLQYREEGPSKSIFKKVGKKADRNAEMFKE
jgi:hypothetical protein